ncbi:MotA/TolQ/ExbB proton channel family protein [Algihabitans albus]|uniref:MotA/TolQ/ExbB proton channel family protein n=1 Tax=Algihabitans albus TaxID=2164067 RepID=UPI000E5D7635|nr:MotA/TolQ/ExbB proton channel family protein [Algihabitans albus]
MSEQTEAANAAESDGSSSGIEELSAAGLDAPALNADGTLVDPAGPTGLVDQGLALFQAGGPVVAILAVMSVVSLAIVFVKLWQFRAARLGDGRTAQESLWLWRTGRTGEALALADSSRNPVAQALARALRGQRRGLPEARVREEVLRYGTDVLEALRSWFRPLEVIASLAPLLGLFGTVLGMIEAFRQLEAAGNQVNPAILSGGIWEALLTTAVGLAVAIPVVALLNWLERRVDRLAHEMDSTVTCVFTDDLSAETEEDRNHAGAGFRPVPAAAGE